MIDCRCFASAALVSDFDRRVKSYLADWGGILGAHHPAGRRSRLPRSRRRTAAVGVGPARADPDVQIAGSGAAHRRARLTQTTESMTHVADGFRMPHGIKSRNEKGIRCGSPFGAKSVTAPATVSGERPRRSPLSHGLGKDRVSCDPQVRRPAITGAIGTACNSTRTGCPVRRS